MGATGTTGYIISAIAGGITAGAGYQSLGIGSFSEGFALGSLAGGLGFAANPGNIYGVSRNYTVQQYKYATRDTLHYFFDLSYDKSPLFGNWFGGGFASPSLGGTAVYAGITTALGPPETNNPGE